MFVHVVLLLFKSNVYLSSCQMFLIIKFIEIIKNIYN